MNNDLQLDSLIKQMAEGHQSELPAPGLIWWRAQILRKQREQERIERPLRIMRLIAVVVVLAVLAAEIPVYWSGFEGIFARQSWLSLPVVIVILIASLFSASFLWSTAKNGNR